jgi:hypothetical protein
MKNLQENLQELGFIDTKGKADINALNALSGVTYMEFVYTLYSHVGEDIEALNNIHQHMAFLFNAGHDDELIRFVNILVSVTDLEQPETVGLVLQCDITKRAYLYEMLADFREVVEDFYIEAGLIDFENAEPITVEYSSAVPSV